MSVLSHAEDLIFSNPDSALLILDSINTSNLGKKEQQYWQLLYEFAHKNELTSDSTLRELITFFEKRHYKSELCKAYFVTGLWHWGKLHSGEAVMNLKQSSNYISFLDKKDPFAGMIYYKLGEIAEHEQLYQIAYNYYNQACRYFEESDQYHFLFYCYRDMARTANDVLTENQKDSLYDLAIQQTNLYYNKVLTLDIQYQQELNSQHTDSIKLIQAGHFLCDSIGINRYAGELAKYYLSHNETKKGAYYLEKYAQDTLFHPWYKEEFYNLYSQLLFNENRTKEAYWELQKVQKMHFQQICEDTRQRAYIIGQHFDVEQEQQKNLQLKIEKQHLWIVIGCVFMILILMCLILSLIILRHRKRQYELEQYQQKIKQKQQIDELLIQQLEKEKNINQQALKRNLLQRIELTKYVQLSLNNEDRDYPKWLKTYLNKNTFTNKNTWQQFLIEFDGLHNNLLTNLQTKYSELTEKDLQYLALVILGLNTNDMCFLLNTNDRTIWNRRQRIKNHLGDTHLDLDKWIKKL